MSCSCQRPLLYTLLAPSCFGRTHVVLARNLLDVGADLERERAVEAAGGLVEEEDLGVGDEAAGDAEALLLAAAEALFDGRADDGVRLAVQAEGGDEVVDALDEFGFGNVAACC